LEASNCPELLLPDCPRERRVPIVKLFWRLTRPLEHCLAFFFPAALSLSDGLHGSETRFPPFPGLGGSNPSFLSRLPGLCRSGPLGHPISERFFPLLLSCLPPQSLSFPCQSLEPWPFCRVGRGIMQTDARGSLQSVLPLPAGVFHELSNYGPRCCLAIVFRSFCPPGFLRSPSSILLFLRLIYDSEDSFVLAFCFRLFPLRG